MRAEQSFSSKKEVAQASATSSLRGYQTNIELNFHGDGSDALLERVPAHVAALQRPVALDVRGQLADGASHQGAPVFRFHEGRLNVLYKRGYIDLARPLPGAPSPTSDQLAAMDALEETLNHSAFYHEFVMRPGDIQITNNYAILPARTAFEDHDDAELARHMFRIWATLRRNRRPLPPEYANTREFAESHMRRRRLGDV